MSRNEESSPFFEASVAQPGKPHCSGTVRGDNLGSLPSPSNTHLPCALNSGSRVSHTPSTLSKSLLIHILNYNVVFYC